LPTASTGILAGEVEFDFDRSTSWKSFFHKDNRHPMFSIVLSFSMDADKPSTASVTLDDQCSLHVHISVGGGHTYNASW
jgi:hypothetical protein